jgi:hypothetical protein
MPIYPIAANVQVSATALPLPDGASTEATLSAVNNKLPALVGGKIPVSGTVELDAGSLAALENISVTFPATQNVNVTNAGLAVTGPLTDTELRATAVDVYPKQGTTVTNTSFSNTAASSPLVSAVPGREVLTVFNEGAGNLHISPGATCTTASYQVRLSAGDYWECPAGQLSLAHVAVFATAGTARVTQVS